MRNLYFKSAILISLFSLLIILLPSCRKEGDTIAVITVVDTTGARIPGATVRMFGTPSSGSLPGYGVVIDDQIVTDAQGQATFNYTENFKLGQAGFAVLDVMVAYGNLEGSALVKVEEEVTTEQTVIAFPK